MATTSDDLLKIARRGAEKVTLTKHGWVPPLEDIEEECETEIEEMLSVLQDEEIFGEVDLNEQQKLVDQIEAALPENRREMVTQLTDEHMRHVWLQQEAAYHLGVAVGMKIAAGRTPEELDDMQLARETADEADEDL
jgi:hypothetical protein